jgi:hypothetical protein
MTNKDAYKKSLQARKETSTQKKSIKYRPAEAAPQQ